VDGFDQHTLVLEKVTLGTKVEVMEAKEKVELGLRGWAYISLVIFLESLYFLRSLLSTLCLLIQRTFWGILAPFLPFLLPWPLCLPVHQLGMGMEGVTLSSGLVELLDSGGGVHVHLSSHDQTVLVELSDVLSCTKSIR
jgi:hypothetical protein